MANTALGTPYVTSSDYVTNYPTTSLALANSIDTLGRGTVAFASRTTAQGSITTTQDLTGLSVTFTAQASRYYMIHGFGTCYSSVGNDPFGLIIANSGGTTLAHTNAISQSNLYGWGINTFLRVSPGAGSVTYKLRAYRNGSGTLTWTPDATTPSFIHIYDVGPV